MNTFNKQQILSFEGGHIEIGKHADFDLKKALTIAAWVRPTTGSGLQATILSKDYQAYEPQIQNGRFVFERGPEYQTSANRPIALGQWVYLAVTFDATLASDNIKLYINGELDSTANAASPLHVTNRDLLLGKRPGWNNGKFRGAMASIAIWNSAHSSWQIKQDYGSRVNLQSDDLVAYWMMEDGQGGTVRDSGPRGHHGTIHGAVRWQPVNEPILVNSPNRRLHRNTSAQRLAQLSESGQGEHEYTRATLPPSGRNGEATKFLNRVKLHNAQRIADHQRETNERLKQAKASAAQQLDQAHRDAAKKLNSTRFDYLYFLSRSRIHRVDSKGIIEPFHVGNVQHHEVDVPAATKWHRTGLHVTASEAVNVDYISGHWHISPHDRNLDANGTRRFNAFRGYVLPGQRAGMLIGRIGGTVFPVGNHRQAPPGLTGELELVTNDDIESRAGAGFADNSGSIKVRVTLTKDPISIVASDIAIDQAAKRVFWSQATRPFTLHACDLDGGNHRVIVEDPDRPITSVAIDPVGKRVFHIMGTGEISSVSYDGENHQSILNISGPSKEGYWQIELDSPHGKMYWTNDFSIWRADLDGKNAVQVLSSHDAPFPIDLTIDSEAGKLYWIDKELQVVRRSQIDGSTPEDLYSVRHPLRGLCLDQVTEAQQLSLTQEVYWSAWEARIRDLTPGIARYYPLGDGAGGQAANPLDQQAPLDLSPVQAELDDLPPPIRGHFGLRFNGTDFLRLPSERMAALSNSSFTIELWAKVDDVTKVQALLAHDATEANKALSLMVRNRRLHMGFYNNETPGQTVLEASRWYHLAFRYDKEAQEQAIFVDGELDVAATGHAPLDADADTPALLGRYLTDNFAGIIADLRVATRALPPAEIQRTMKERKVDAILDGIDLHPAWRCNEAPPMIERPDAVLEFDGVSSYVKLGTAQQLGLTASSFTIESWIRIEQPSEGDQTVLGCDARVPAKGLHFVIRAGMPYMSFYGDDLASSTRLSAGEWYHLAWRYDSTTREQALFINGHIDAKRTAAEHFLGEDEVYLGRWDRNRMFHGCMCDLRIWSTPRSDEEVAANYRHYRETFGARGPCDGSAEPEHLFEIPAEGGLNLVSKLSLEHEKRLLAARKRKAAHAKAARDIATAHVDYDRQVAGKHAELKRVHSEQDAQINAKKAEHERDRTANRAKLQQGQTDSSNRIDASRRDAATKRARAQQHAATIKSTAHQQANTLKTNAKRQRDTARAERDRNRR